LLIIAVIFFLGCISEIENQKPVAGTGANQIVKIGDTVQLDGSGSYDNDGDTLEYNWSIKSQPVDSTATLSDSTVMKPSFEPDIAGEYIIEFVVNDGKVDSNTATMIVTAISYWVEPQQDDESMNYNFLYYDHHFLTIIDDDQNGSCILRPHPGFDLDGWGSSWYAQPFLPRAVLRHTDVGIDSFQFYESGIKMDVSGYVSREEANTYGTWNLIMNFTYNMTEKKIIGNGVYIIQLDDHLSMTTGDLNIFKLASNYLDDVPLLSGGIGDTGDMEKAVIMGDNFNFTWIPPLMPSHFPIDITDMLSIDVIGQYNNINTSAQGYASINDAYKPSVKIVLKSRYHDINMTFGGFYTVSESKQFWSDNVGITPLILKKSTRTDFMFDVTFESVALPGDTG